MRKSNEFNNFYTLIVFRNNELYEKRVYKNVKRKQSFNPLQGLNQ